MDAPSRRDWQHLHEATLHVHEAPSLQTLPGRVLEGLQRLFAFDSGSVQDDRGGAAEVPWMVGDKVVWQGNKSPGAGSGVRVMPSEGPDLLPLRPAWLAVSADRHPHTSYYRRTGDGAAQRMSDVVPMPQLRRSRFFNEISRPLGLTWQLTTFIALPSTNTLTLAACRSQTNFDARERLLLDLLRPHVATAWRRAVRAEQPPANPPLLQTSCSEALVRLGITRREAEVLIWVSQGKTNREIAIILELSPLTVKLHVERILSKLGCETRTAAACMALEAGAFHRHDGSPRPG